MSSRLRKLEQSCRSIFEQCFRRKTHRPSPSRCRSPVLPSFQNPEKFLGVQSFRIFERRCTDSEISSRCNVRLDLDTVSFEYRANKSSPLKQVLAVLPQLIVPIRRSLNTRVYSSAINLFQFGRNVSKSIQAFLAKHRTLSEIHIHV